MKDLGVRVSSGIIGLALLIFIIIKGGILLNVFILGLSLIGIRELLLAFKQKGFNPITSLAYLITILIYMDVNKSYGELILTISTLIFMLSILSKKYNILDVAITYISILYIPLLLKYIVYLDKTKYIWLIFVIAFGTDTFAYFAGNLFGKNKLCPNISPNKTIEGSLGGILGSALVTIIFSMIFKLSDIYLLIIVSIVASISSQLGDLIASSIKRYVGIKDYGFLIPGHGGVLDRFDSIIFTAPIVYYYYLFIL